MDKEALFKLGYGLYVVTGKDEKDNGCVVNTVMQITDSPKRILIGMNKSNYTHDTIRHGKQLNVSVLSEESTLDVYEKFGFQSGKDVDKFAGYGDCARSENGIFYLTKGTNAYLSGRVEELVDCGTHTIFIAEITDAKVLNNVPTATYGFYQKNIKAKTQPVKKKGYICKICGYIYEGEELPKDFVCPVCKHGAEDFDSLFSKKGYASIQEVINENL